MLAQRYKRRVSKYLIANRDADVLAFGDSDFLAAHLSRLCGRAMPANFSSCATMR